MSESPAWPDVPAFTRKAMQANKSKNSNPEMTVRRLVHGMGYRYRLHRNDLPGKPDIVFPSRHKILFIHGCFWHQHEAAGCRGSRIPKTRVAYWQPKLMRNRERDEHTIIELNRSGWDVLVIWECWLNDLARTANVLSAFLDGVVDD